VAVTLEATPGAADANSFEEVEEADEYFETRLHAEVWVDADPADKTIALIMATRVISASLSPYRYYVSDGNFYRTRSTWTGVPSTSTQALPWPRIGMQNRNGVDIPDDEIPVELKQATSELALVLLSTDVTADNPVITGGITDLTAGPVSLSFKDYIETKVLPNAVLDMLVPSWLTDEVIEGRSSAVFRVVRE
jgi:DnaT-like ssDNA binding protein